MEFIPFYAVYNPYIRKLTTFYGTNVDVYFFTDDCEWTTVYYNDEENSRFLHVHLDYDETCQLIFYSRQDNDESLHEELTESWNSGLSLSYGNIIIVHTDNEEEIILNEVKRRVDLNIWN